MDQEHADYEDDPGRRRRPWTPFQIAILIAIIFLSLPLAAIAMCIGVVVLGGGMEGK